MPTTGLKEFREVITDVRSIPTWTVNAAIAAPLADFVLHIGAPWPVGVPAITCVAEIVSLMCIFHLWNRKNQKQLSKRIVIVLLLLGVSSFVYLFFLDSYTYVNPSTSRRYAKGFTTRPEIQQLIPEHFKSAEDALIGLEYKEEDVWTLPSITAVRLTLFSCWLLMFTSLSIFIGTFVMAQRRRRVR